MNRAKPIALMCGSGWDDLCENYEEAVDLCSLLGGGGGVCV